MKYYIYALLALSLFSIKPLIAMEATKALHFLNEEQIGNAFLGKTTHNKVCLTQVESIDQFTTEGSSGASCGYHALRNLIIILKAALNSEERINLRDELGSHEDMLNKLGPEGIWRELIRQRRGTNSADWLSSDELKALIKSILGDVAIGAFGDYPVSQIDPHGELQEALDRIMASTPGQIQEGFSDLLDLSRKKKDFIGGALIYQDLPISAIEKISAACYCTVQDWLSLTTGTSLYRPQQNLRGHWIPLAIISLDGKQQYLVTDSAGNISRLNDERVEQVSMLIENRRFERPYPILDSRYQKESEKLEELRDEVSIVAFEQEREILGRIETLERYERSKSILLSLIVLASIYVSYRYFCSPKEANATTEDLDSPPLKAYHPQ